MNKEFYFKKLNTSASTANHLIQLPSPPLICFLILPSSLITPRPPSNIAPLSQNITLWSLNPSHRKNRKNISSLHIHRKNITLTSLTAPAHTYLCTIICWYKFYWSIVTNIHLHVDPIAVIKHAVWRSLGRKLRKFCNNQFTYIVTHPPWWGLKNKPLLWQSPTPS